VPSFKGPENNPINQGLCMLKKELHALVESRRATNAKVNLKGCASIIMATFDELPSMWTLSHMTTYATSLKCIGLRR
jgi:hypothetical protein